MLSGMSGSELDEMPVDEWLRWCKYDRQEPVINGYMLDVLFAKLMYVVAAVGGAKNVSMDTFRTFTDAPKKSSAEILATLRRVGFKEE